MGSNLLAMGVTVLKSQIPDEGSLEDKLRTAMKASLSDSLFWGPSEDDRFRMSVAAVMLCVDEEDKERLEKEFRLLQSLNAAISGVPVDFERLFEDGGVKAVGLMKLWEETKRAVGK